MSDHSEEPETLSNVHLWTTGESSSSLSHIASPAPTLEDILLFTRYIVASHSAPSSPRPRQREPPTVEIQSAPTSPLPRRLFAEPVPALVNRRSPLPPTSSGSSQTISSSPSLGSLPSVKKEPKVTSSSSSSSSSSHTPTTPTSSSHSSNSSLSSIEMACYMNWDDCRGIDVLAMHQFAELRDLLAFVRMHQHTGFHIHANRNKLVAAFRDLGHDAPFDRNRRFPERGQYVDIDNVQFRTDMDIILSACDLPDRQINVTNNAGETSRAVQDAKRAFDVAFSAIRKMLLSTDESVRTTNGIYTRNSFEAEQGLLWGVPADP